MALNQSVWERRTQLPSSASEKIKISRIGALRSVSLDLDTICRNVRKLKDQLNLSDNLRKILFPGLVRPQQATGLTHSDIGLSYPCPSARPEPVGWWLGGVIVVGSRHPSSPFQSSGSCALLAFHKQAQEVWFRMWGLGGERHHRWMKTEHGRAAQFSRPSDPSVWSPTTISLCYPWNVEKIQTISIYTLKLMTDALAHLLTY